MVIKISNLVFRSENIIPRARHWLRLNSIASRTKFKTNKTTCPCNELDKKPLNISTFKSKATALNKKRFAVAIFSALFYVTTMASPIATKKDWKSATNLDQINPGASRSNIISAIGTGQRTNLSDMLDTPYSVIDELYKDNDSEVQILYKNNIVVGVVFREFGSPTIKKSPMGSSGSYSHWILGASSFEDLNHKADATFAKDYNGKSICKIERHNFTPAGKYQDYYFSYNLVAHEEGISIKEMRPDSLMVVNTNALCNVGGPKSRYEECKRQIRMLACTPSSDFM